MKLQLQLIENKTRKMQCRQLKSFGDWEFKKKLGCGSFGEVSVWKNRKTSQCIATKRCLKNPEQMQIDEVEKLKQRWRQEHKWMNSLDTEFIVHGIDIKPKKFIEYLFKSHNWDLPVIIMEYCNGGDLRTEMEKIENFNGLREYDIRQIMHCLSNAVSYLHDNFKITHRDIKPDNVVIHRLDGGKQTVYKLADLGFARHISKETIEASVVGTKNYFAPEIIDEAKYTNTVDYWSLGVIAFEMICGVCPFIPHQTLFNIITNIKRKEKNCIAITEKWSSEIFVQHSEIFPENHVSIVFRKRIQNWLRLTLDQNYKNRGHRIEKSDSNATDERILTFYKDLDDVLQSKILTVFCLNTYQLYSYEVDKSLTLLQLSNNMEKDTKINKKNFFFIFPSDHPTKKLSANTNTLDLYVENYRPDFNATPMIYLLGYKCEYLPLMPVMSSQIRELLQMNDAKLPQWVERDILMHTNYLLNREQNHLRSLMTGLHEYSLTIENELCGFEKTERMIAEKTCNVSGYVEHFAAMVNQAKGFVSNDDTEIVNISIEFQEYVRNFNNEITNVNEVQKKIEIRTRSAIRRIRDHLQNSFFEDIVNEDIFKTLEFGKLIDDWRLKMNTGKSILSQCQSHVYHCIEERENFLSNPKLNNLKCNIDGIHEEYRKMCEIVKNMDALIINLKEKVLQMTEEFQKRLYEVGRTKDVGWLKYDELSTAIGLEEFDIFNQPTTEFLIREAYDNIELLNSIQVDLYNFGK